MRWTLACMIAVASMTAGWAGDTTVKLTNGKSIVYTDLKVNKRSIFVATAGGGKTLAFDAFKPTSLPVEVRAAVRNKVLGWLTVADGIHDRKHYEQAVPHYQFVKKCFGYLKPADLDAGRRAVIQKKALGLVLVDGLWITIKEDAANRAKALEKEMLAKGMVKHQGKWVTPRQRRRLEAYAKAEGIVRRRSFAKVPVAVVHRQPGKTLCRANATTTDGKAVKALVIVSDPAGQLKKGKSYLVDLFWSGQDRYFYDGGVRVAPSFSLTMKDARELVVKRLNLLPKKSRGTGFAITKSGYIVTNHHVIEDAFAITVHVGDKSFKAKMVAVDKVNDLAIIKVDHQLKPLALAVADAKLGQTVFTVGYPMTDIQGTAPKVTRGVISALRGVHDDESMYQTDVSVQFGNSGGALADKKGHVAGVVCGKASFQAFLLKGGSLPENVNYAIKKAKLMEFLKKHPKIEKELVKPDDAAIAFEDAVSRVVAATVRIVVNDDGGSSKH